MTNQERARLEHLSALEHLTPDEDGEHRALLRLESRERAAQGLSGPATLPNPLPTPEKSLQRDPGKPAAPSDPVDHALTSARGAERRAAPQQPGDVARALAASIETQALALAQKCREHAARCDALTSAPRPLPAPPASPAPRVYTVLVFADKPGQDGTMTSQTFVVAASDQAGAIAAMRGQGTFMAMVGRLGAWVFVMTDEAAQRNPQVFGCNGGTELSVGEFIRWRDTQTTPADGAAFDEVACSCAVR